MNRSQKDAAAVYLGAKETDENDTLLILPSDHFIGNNQKFIDVINRLRKNILNNFWYVFGVTPSNPSTAYGYIKVIKDSVVNNLLVHNVLSFEEKPSLKNAKSMLSSGDYLWNAGIFMGQSNMIINSMRRYCKDITIQCDKVFKKRIFNKTDLTINYDINLFAKINFDSVDYAVLEKEKSIKCVKLNTIWDDLGSWENFLNYVDVDDFKNNVVEIDGQNKFFNLDNRIIGTTGVRDLIVIDTKEATLISKKNNSGNIIKLMSALQKKSIEIPSELSFDERPWGKYFILLNEDFIKVKKLVIFPRKSISLQYHNKRSEHWVVVSGVANVMINNKKIVMKAGESIDIPIRAHHYLKNNKNENLVIIEIQMGSYLEEDDIIRLKDPYNRV